MKAKVIRDVIAERMGIPTTVGSVVNVELLVPPLQPIGMRTEKGVSACLPKYPVYLTTGGRTRTQTKDQDGNILTKLADTVFLVRLDGVLYSGNDVFSLEELEILPCE